MVKEEDLVKMAGAYDADKDVYKLVLKLSAKAKDMVNALVVKKGKQTTHDGLVNQERYLVKKAIANSYSLQSRMGMLFECGAIDESASERVLYFSTYYDAQKFALTEVRSLLKEIAEARVSMAKKFDATIVLRTGKAEHESEPASEEDGEGETEREE